MAGQSQIKRSPELDIGHQYPGELVQITEIGIFTSILHRTRMIHNSFKFGIKQENVVLR